MCFLRFLTALTVLSNTLLFAISSTVGVTAGSPCIISSVTLEFTCEEKGRFYNPNDISCTKYYLCSLLRNGSLIQTPYTCPKGSWFDQDIQKCSASYQCPCSITFATTSSTSLTSEQTTTSEVSPLTTEPTTIDDSTTSSAQFSTTTTPCTVSNITIDFNCEERGRFRDPNDVTCTKYYLCSQLRNGSLIQTPYTCPKGSWFDQDVQKCSASYQCPCSITSPTTSSTFLTSEQTTASEVSPLTTEPTTIDDSSTSSDQFSTTTTPCTVSNITIDFNCKERGRYRDPNDVTCTKYYLCSLLRNGSLIQTPYICPKNSWFDQDVQKCSASYQCPCSITFPTTTSTSLTSELTTTSEVSPLTTETTTTYNSTTSSAQFSTTTMPCTVSNITIDFNCEERGRFRDPNDATCTKYYLCSQLRNGSLIQTPYTCPKGSWFDQESQKCSASYQCPCSITFATTSSTSLTSEQTTTSEVSPLTTEPTTIDDSSTSSDQFSTTTTPCTVSNITIDFNCKERGRYRDPNDVTCTKYYLCSQLRNGSLIQTPYTCPKGSWFDQDSLKCSASYQCPCSITFATTSSTFLTSEQTTASEVSPLTTEPTTIDDSTTSSAQFLTTTTPCTVSNITIDFNCKERGRYRDPNDVTCTKYYLCSQLRNGSLIQTPYTCPKGSWFDQDSLKCSASYQCPCSITFATTSSTFLTSEQTTASEVSPLTTEPTTIDDSTTSSAQFLTTTTPCTVSNITIDFNCEERGRFRDPNDVTCTKYYLCSLLRNGSLIQTPYICPKNSWFDQDVQKCSASYQCPCSITFPTTTSTSLTSEQTTTSEVSPLTTEPTTTYNSTTSSAQFSTSTTSCTVSNITIDFNCEERGRFRDPNDVTCTKYYLCSLLRNGSLIQTPYTCPKGSWFDQESQKCSASYQCPCSITFPTTSSTSLTSEQTTANEVSALTTEPTTIDDSTTSSAQFSTTTRSCTVSNITIDFNCEVRGRFRNPNDVTCTKYYLCSQLRNGSLIQTPYTCPKGSWFDQDLQKCSTSYQCPCSITFATSSTSLTSEQTTTSKVSPLTTEPTTIYNSTTSSAQFSTTTTPCTVSNITIDFNCEERGRFRDPNDVTCTKYYLCSQLRNGSLIQTPYTCPKGSWFDQDSQKCSASYQCPCSITFATTSSTSLTSEQTTTSEVSQLTTEPTTIDDSTTSSAQFSTTTTPCTVSNITINFNCEERGRFTDPNDVTCTKYYLCSLLRNGSLIQTPYICPKKSWFDQDLQKCSVSYQCPCSITFPTTSSTFLISEQTTTSKVSALTTEPTTVDKSTTSSAQFLTTMTPCTVSNITIDFNCVGTGKFRDPNDVTCTKFYICSWNLRNGSLIAALFKCPEGFWFDQKFQICSANYQCPCIITFPTTSSTSLSSEQTTTSKVSALTTKPTTVDKSTTSSAQFSTTTTPCAVSNITIDFNCVGTGKFRDPNDVTCTRFYICSWNLRNGSLIPAPFKCPEGSWFDQKFQICSARYQCPCSSSDPHTFLNTKQTTTSASLGSTTPRKSSTFPCFLSNITINFTCSEGGNFVDPNDLTCTKFYACSLFWNGTFSQTLYRCPNGSSFDQDLQRCSERYQCPCVNANAITNSTSSISKSTF